MSKQYKEFKVILDFDDPAPHDASYYKDVIAMALMQTFSDAVGPAMEIEVTVVTG